MESYSQKTIFPFTLKAPEWTPAPAQWGIFEGRFL